MTGRLHCYFKSNVCVRKHVLGNGIKILVGTERILSESVLHVQQRSKVGTHLLIFRFIY